MGIGVNAPKTPVHEGSSDIAAATVPNVCKMPGPPAPFVPTPLPNIGTSNTSASGYSKRVSTEKKDCAIKGASYKSKGDIASKGTGGGLVSATTHDKTKFVAPGSMDVKFEGKNVQLLGDAMTNNNGGAANSATMPGNIQAPATPAFASKVGDQDLADALCEAACDAMDKGEHRTHQDKMASHFSEGRPVYTPNNNKILPEVTSKIPGPGDGGVPQTLVSGTGRTLPNGTSAGMAMMKAMRSCAKGTSSRWDFVVPGQGGLPAVDKYVEVKFPGDELTPNQKAMRKAMNPRERAKIIEMNPEEDCECS